MKIAQIIAATVFIGVAAPAALADQAPYPQTEEELRAEYDRLRWEESPGSYTLARSHSTLDLPAGYLMLRGEDALRYTFLVNGTEFANDEAVIVDPETGETVIFAYYPTGYVTDGDWDNVDADALLEGIRRGTDAANEDRAANGVPALHVKGWLQPPRYDAERKIAFWSLLLEEDGSGEIVNAVALRLSRRGYHEITWIGDPEDQHRAGAALEAMFGGHHYDEGFRYADYIEGDKLAGFGIASLVAASAGSKPGKGLIAAILGAVVLFLKKAWMIIPVALGGLWVGLKRLFARKAGDESSPSTEAGG